MMNDDDDDDDDDVFCLRYLFFLSTFFYQLLLLLLQKKKRENNNEQQQQQSKVQRQEENNSLPDVPHAHLQRVLGRDRERGVHHSMRASILCGGSFSFLLLAFSRARVSLSLSLSFAYFKNDFVFSRLSRAFLYAVNTTSQVKRTYRECCEPASVQSVKRQCSNDT